jgi:hypothetical protein
MDRMTGFTITRRTILWLPATLLLRPLRAAAADPWEEFLAAAQPLGKDLVKDPSPAGVDAYLHRLAALAGRVRTIPAHPFGTMSPGIELGPAFRGVPFVVIEWKMAPSTTFPPHNHPGYSVCTVGLEGECEVEHFEPQGGDRVRRTRLDTIEPGRTDSLSPTRDNIHTFRTGKKAVRAMDITTLHAPKDTGFQWLTVGDKVDDRSFRASWRKGG